jgi:uncharacterized membrane protein YecN with MAPEG domain
MDMLGIFNKLIRICTNILFVLAFIVSGFALFVAILCFFDDFYKEHLPFLVIGVFLTWVCYFGSKYAYVFFNEKKYLKYDKRNRK